MRDIPDWEIRMTSLPGDYYVAKASRVTTLVWCAFAIGVLAGVGLTLAALKI